jgi:hypothetical protein
MQPTPMANADANGQTSAQDKAGIRTRGRLPGILPLPRGKAHRIAASNTTATKGEQSMRRYIIERDIPKVGTFEREQLREAAKTSNAALAKLGTDIQWVQSYVADNKTFCVYLAKDEAIIRRHAEISGFPATKITEIRRIFDPTTATS